MMRKDYSINIKERAFQAEEKAKNGKEVHIFEEQRGEQGAWCIMVGTAKW